MSRVSRVSRVGRVSGVRHPRSEKALFPGGSLERSDALHDAFMLRLSLHRLWEKFFECLKSNDRRPVALPADDTEFQRDQATSRLCAVATAERPPPCLPYSVPSSVPSSSVLCPSVRRRGHGRERRASWNCLGKVIWRETNEKSPQQRGRAECDHGER